jgi:hypothetical protein
VPTSPAQRVAIFDVDGVVSPIRPAESPWGGWTLAGDVVGPVLVAPEVCRRLDALDQIPGVACWWLTSWTSQMRAALDPFPGHGWPVVGHQTDYRDEEPSWWKLTAVVTWLHQHPEVRSIAWCDDHLRGGRPAAARRQLGVRSVETMLMAPATAVGLTPHHLDRLDTWARA